VHEIARWTDAFWQRRADQVVPTVGGCAVLTPTFPSAHDHNRVLVAEPCDADALASATDEVLGGLKHRLITVGSADLADALTPGLTAHGYERGDDLVMAFTGTAHSRGAVEELDLAERSRVATRAWKREQPDWDPDVCRQLGERAATATRACDATFLGARDTEGHVIARVDLYVHDGIAQVEEVMTDPAHQGRGLASLLVTEAVVRAQAAGARRVFLVADADDWPQELYRRLGFSDLGTTASFTR
jgi:ribosomal protein S18 acetylase RimI-like enzyme